MQCRDFLEIADSYLRGELLVETNHDVIKHLEACRDCRRELTSRREVSGTLRTAFRNSPDLQISEQFAIGLRSKLHEAALQQPAPSEVRPRIWLAIAACLIVAIGVGVLGLRYRSRIRSNSNSTTNQIARSNSEPGEAMTELAGLAVGDHKNCALEFRLASAPTSLEEASRTYDRGFLNLAESVKERLVSLASPATVIEAHSCIFAGKRFAHLVLKQDNHVVSLLITNVEDQVPVAGTIAASPKDLQAISCSQVAGYRVSCFKTASHAIFVVSDLSEADNLTLARSLAPSLQQHFSKFESAAFKQLLKESLLKA